MVVIDGKRPFCSSAKILKMFSQLGFGNRFTAKAFQQREAVRCIKCHANAHEKLGIPVEKSWGGEFAQQLVFPRWKLALLGRCSSFSPLGVLLLHCAFRSGSVCCGPEWIKQTVVKVSLICITSRQPCRTLCWQEITVFVTFFQWSPFGRDWPCDQD